MTTEATVKSSMIQQDFLLKSAKTWLLGRVRLPFTELLNGLLERPPVYFSEGQEINSITIKNFNIGLL